MFIWALLGMELFAYRAVLDETGTLIAPEQAKDKLERGEIAMFTYPRENFNNIWSSMVTVYILINGEDWNVLMNNLVRVYDKNDLGSSSWIPELYCVFAIIMGNLTLLALLTGILLQGFLKHSAEMEAKDPKQDQLDFEQFWSNVTNG